MPAVEFNTTTVLVGIGGAVVLYGAVTNRNPIDVIKLTLQGKDIAGARPLSTSSSTDLDNVSAETPGSVDSLGLTNPISGFLSSLGINGSIVLVPYAGHPVGSDARNSDIGGFMGGIAGKNSSYPKTDPRYNSGVQTSFSDGRKSGGGTF
jgi:hypothetical protein